jgi:hypothetical protein
MKRWIIFLGGFVAVALFFSVSAHAKNQFAIPVIPTETTATVGACKFKITNLFGGKLIIPNPKATPPRQGIYDLPDTGPKASSVIRSFALFCIDASDKEIGTRLNAKQVNGNWFRYTPWPLRDETELEPFEPGAHPQTVQFKGSNWSGVGLTVDDTTGDEKRRSRTFYFCLIHQAHALCGNSPVQWFADPKNRNELWKIRAILQSVEFVDAPSTMESSPENGAASVPKQ